MSDKVKIAIDTMSGENSPKKIIEGINISLLSNQENFFFLYGQQDLIEKEITKNKLVQQNCKIINTEEIIVDDESPLNAALRVPVRTAPSTILGAILTAPSASSSIRTTASCPFWLASISAVNSYSSLALGSAPALSKARVSSPLPFWQAR